MLQQPVGAMSAAIKAMSTEAMSHNVATMTSLRSQGVFKQYISNSDPWDPDSPPFACLWDLFTQGREVYCRNEGTGPLQPTIGCVYSRAYRLQAAGPWPCFNAADCMFASKWLGPDAMPAAFIVSWPPPEARLEAMSHNISVASVHTMAGVLQHMETMIHKL